MGWANLIVIGTYFVMREVELAFAKVARVKIDRGGEAVHTPLASLEERPSGDSL